MYLLIIMYNKCKGYNYRLCVTQLEGVILRQFAAMLALTVLSSARFNSPLQKCMMTHLTLKGFLGCICHCISGSLENVSKQQIRWTNLQSLNHEATLDLNLFEVSHSLCAYWFIFPLNCYPHRTACSEAAYNDIITVLLVVEQFCFDYTNSSQILKLYSPCLLE